MTANEAGGHPRWWDKLSDRARHALGYTEPTPSKPRTEPDGTGWQRLPLKPWSVRIPDAIARAKELVKRDAGDWYANDKAVVITATEVALAEALWDYTQILMHGTEKQAMLERHPTIYNAPALIAFCEKVEALDN